MIVKLSLVPQPTKNEQDQQLKLFRLLDMKRDLLKMAKDLERMKTKLQMRLIQNESPTTSQPQK